MPRPPFKYHFLFDEIVFLKHGFVELSSARSSCRIQPFGKIYTSLPVIQNLKFMRIQFQARIWTFKVYHYVVAAIQDPVTPLEWILVIGRNGSVSKMWRPTVLYQLQILGVNMNTGFPLAAGPDKLLCAVASQTESSQSDRLILLTPRRS